MIRRQAFRGLILGFGGRLGGQGGDLDQVVGEDPVPGPDPGPVKVIEAAAIPPVLPFQSADAGFAAGAPLHRSAERRPMLASLAGFAGSALARDDYRADAECRSFSTAASP